MKSGNRWRILARFAAAAGLAAAAPGADVEESVTLDRCLAEATRNQPDLLAAQRALSRSETDLVAAGAPFLPSASGNAGYSGSGSTTRDDADRDGASAGVAASYNLFNGFGDRARLAQAEAAVFQSRADLGEIAARVSARVLRGFSSLLYAQEQVRLAASIAERRSQNVELIQLRYDGGNENKGALLRGQAGLKQAEFDLDQARRGRRVAQRELGASIGRDEAVRFTAEGDLAAGAPPEDPDFELLYRDTPAFARAEARRIAAEAGVTLARSAFYPTLDLRASYDRNGEGTALDEDGWSAALSASVPFYTGGRNRANLAGARFERDRVGEQNRATANDERSTLERLWAAFRDALGQRDVQEAFLRAAEVRSEIARTQYATGLIGFQDWDQIEDELINAQTQYLATRRNAVSAEADWLEALGASRLPSSP
jgi:outer membrane protein